MSCDQALDKLSEKLNNRLLVQEEHGFQKEGKMCPPGRRSSKKSLAWIGLSVKSTLQWPSSPSDLTEQNIPGSKKFALQFLARIL